MERMNMSARAHDHILKVARTIADLEGAALDVLDHLSRGAHRPYHVASTALPTWAQIYRFLNYVRDTRKIVIAWIGP
jgi:hypothetical protein